MPEHVSGGDPSLPTRLLDGRLLLHQPRGGHRVGTDAVLLAAATTPGPGDRVIDVGSGVGSVGLAVALRVPSLAVRLLEIVPAMAALARDNVALNGLDGRVTVAECDLFDPTCRAGLGKAEWVVSNPPFQAAGEGRPSPDALRARAHALDGQPTGSGHGDWLRAMLALAAPKGVIVLIHAPAALPDLIAAAQGRLGHLRVMPIHARADQPAIRILIAGIVGSRTPLALMPPLILHGEDGRFAVRAEELHRGRALLAMVPTRKSRPRGPTSRSV